MARKSRKNTVNTQPEILNTAVYIRTAQYIRLSVEDSHNKGNSIENQKMILDDFITRNGNMRLAGVYIDNGATGTSFHRPEFQHMIEDIESGKIDCVIVKDLSRLGREYNETFTYLRRIFPALGVRFIAINDNIDTAKEAVTGDISVSFKGVMNDEYCRDISVKVTSLKSSGKSRTFVPKIRQ